MRPLTLTPLLAALVVIQTAPAGQPGPYQVKDIRPGSNGGIADFTKFKTAGEKLVFTANDGKTGWELWESDGTEAGTKLLKDIVEGPASSTPTFLVSAGSKAYFSTSYSTSSSGGTSNGIWVTDGTTAGTVKLSNAGNEPYPLSAVGNTLYFSATLPATGRELWKTDGTAAGTMMVADLYPGTANANLYNRNAGVSIGNVYYFSCTNSGQGTDLWRTNGTSAGTVLVKHIPSGYEGATGLTVIGSTLYFCINDLEHGYELWRSDGTSAGTFMVKDIVPGAGSGVSGYLANAGNQLFFSARLDDKYALWRSDGTEAGTVPVIPLINSVQTLPVIGNEVLFSNLLNGKYELWKSDGTAAGTAPFKPGVGFSVSKWFNRGSTHYFFGVSQIWQSDGTSQGTYSIGSIPGTAYEMVLFGDKLGFIGSTSGGSELHAFDLAAPSIALTTASNRTGSSAIVETAIHGNGLPATAKLEYGLTEAYGTTLAVPLTATATSQFQFVQVPVNGLALGTTYRYRVTATSAKGSRVSTGTFDTLYTREEWRRARFGTMQNTGTAADDQDPDADGINNLIEYAFGLDPNKYDSQLLPKATRGYSSLLLEFTQSPRIDGVTYGVEWSATMAPGSWTAITDSGSGDNRRFYLSTANKQKVFTRWTVTPR